MPSKKSRYRQPKVHSLVFEIPGNILKKREPNFHGFPLTGIDYKRPLNDAGRADGRYIAIGRRRRRRQGYGCCCEELGQLSRIQFDDRCLLEFQFL